MAIPPDFGEQSLTPGLHLGVPFYGNCAEQLGAKVVSEWRRSSVQSGIVRGETFCSIPRISLLVLCKDEGFGGADESSEFQGRLSLKQGNSVQDERVGLRRNALHRKQGAPPAGADSVVAHCEEPRNHRSHHQYDGPRPAETHLSGFAPCHADPSYIGGEFCPARVALADHAGIG